MEKNSGITVWSVGGLIDVASAIAIWYVFVKKSESTKVVDAGGKLEEKLLEECLDEVGGFCREWCRGQPFYEDCIDRCLRECIEEKKREVDK